jgi:hypothetical protein
MKISEKKCELYTCECLSELNITTAAVPTVTDNGNRGQPACPEEWKMCKEEHE